MDPVLQTISAAFLDIIRYPDMSVYEDKTTFITGDSGKGKSTLLKLFNGVLSPSSGRILYKGEDIDGKDTIMLRREVLLIGQQVFLFDNLTIEQNFAEFYAYRALPAPDTLHMRRFMDICAAGFPLETPCGTMSGGEKQRVFNAIYASFEPSVLMLDEPTAALDEENAGNFLESLITGCIRNGECRERRTTTLIVVSHNQSLVKKFADDIIAL